MPCFSKRLSAIELRSFLDGHLPGQSHRLSAVNLTGIFLGTKLP
jgi:hypothetical protein